MLILIVGPPFSGKTVSSCTFPKPMVYVELDTGGFESVKHAANAKGELIVPDWKDIVVKQLHYKEAFDLDFKTAEKDDFKSGKAPEHTKRSTELMKEFNGVMNEMFEKPPSTLIIDSGTTLFRTWKDAILNTNRIPALRIADYGTLEGILFRQFIPTLKSLSADKIKWVILIDHETSDKDEITGILTEFPVGPSSNMGRALAKEFDEVYRQQAVSDGYQWRTRKHGLFVGAGSRLHLPDTIKPATYQELSKYLKV
jgi:hypothetical protein